MDISDDGFVCLFDDNTNETRNDIKLPEGDLGKNPILISFILVIDHLLYFIIFLYSKVKI